MPRANSFRAQREQLFLIGKNFCWIPARGDQAEDSIALVVKHCYSIHAGERNVQMICIDCTRNRRDTEAAAGLTEAGSTW